MVIKYVREKYGQDSVSQIITFGTLSSRAVLKDVGRVLGIPLSTLESITKQIPVEQGKVRPAGGSARDHPGSEMGRRRAPTRRSGRSSRPRSSSKG